MNGLKIDKKALERILAKKSEARIKRMSGAGGDPTDMLNTSLLIGNELDARYGDNKEGKLRDITPNSALQRFGEIFSGVKTPASYADNTDKTWDVIKRIPAAMVQDKQQWDSSPAPTALNARYFLNRRGFMDEKSANKFGGLEYFDKTGDNKYKLPENSKFTGMPGEPMDMLKELPDAKMYPISDINMTYMQELLNPGSTKDKKGIPSYQKMNNYVLGRIDPKTMGEGTDKRGYYNLVGGTDPWDFALSDEDRKKAGELSSMKSLYNGVLGDETKREQLLKYVIRDLTSAFRKSPEVEYQSKVYIPFVKQQPRKKNIGGTSKMGETMRADI